MSFDDGIVSDGTRTERLEPQVLSLLAYLMRHPDRVVSRDELVREVWGGAHVSDGAITRCVGILRKSLAPEYIVTLPKRGYRLAAPVGRRPPRPGGAGIRHRRAWAALVAAVLAGLALLAGRLEAPEEPRAITIAVEPFRDLDDGAREEGWGRSLGDDLVAELHGMPELAVVDPVEGEAQAVLRGSVRREGGRVRVHCELTDRRTRRVLSAGACDVDPTPRIATQERTAACIARSTRRTLAGPS